MSSSKLPSDISTEDILKALSKEAESITGTTSIRIKRTEIVLSFLNMFDIKPGSDPIDRQILFNLYARYERSQKIKRAKKARTFYNKLQDYLKITGSIVYINQKSLDLSERVLNLLKPKERPQLNVMPLQLHFQNFIKKYSIKPGKKTNFIWVTATALYDLYDEWAYSIRKKKPLTFVLFCQFSKIYFPTTKKDSFSKLWISLDDSITSAIESRMKNEEKEST